MKKIIFTLLALVGTMSMNAQVIEVYKGDVLVAKYKASEADNVVFKEVPTTGTEKRTDNIDVKWVQLWENGPKFAEYNIGAANNKAEDYGGYYAWGGSQNKGQDKNSGTDALSGDSDTATKLWGSNWRMPTKEEFDALLNNQNCTCTWTTQNGVNGLLCKGKENTGYSSNSVFLPAAGNCYNGTVGDQGNYADYWSSTPNGSSKAYYLYFYKSGRGVDGDENRPGGYSVRPVLVEE